jgi:glycosyltransferase involved in cell wall biosynthesis
MDKNISTPQVEPLISIITVVLNGAASLEKTFESVFSQDFKNYEYIVIDGGSVDGSVEIIKKHASKLKFWLSESDGGIYHAMNKGLEVASGKWVYFLGSDDYMYNCLTEVAQYLKEDDTIYYGDVYRPILMRKYDGEFSSYKLACRNICQQSIFYPRKVWDKYSFNLTYRIFADYDFNIRCSADTDIHYKYIPVMVSIFNDKDGLSCTGKDKEFDQDRLLLIRDNFSSSIYQRVWIRMKLIKFFNWIGIDDIMLKLYRKI